MQQTQFNELIESIIRPTGDLIISTTPIEWRTGWENELFKDYEKNRAEIRKDMRIDNEIDLRAHRIDRHKIAAALAHSIIKKPPFKTTDLKPGLAARLSNEILAVRVGVQVVTKFMEESLSIKAPGEVVKLSVNPFDFPGSNGADYEVHFAKALYHSYKKCFDHYLVANIFFHLEAYYLKCCGVILAAVPATPFEDNEHQ